MAIADQMSRGQIGAELIIEVDTACFMTWNQPINQGHRHATLDQLDDFRIRQGLGVNHQAITAPFLHKANRTALLIGLMVSSGNDNVLTGGHHHTMHPGHQLAEKG